MLSNGSRFFKYVHASGCHGIGGMGVGLQRGTDVVVAEPGLNIFRVSSILDQHGRVCMPEGMVVKCKL